MLFFTLAGDTVTFVMTRIGNHRLSGCCCCPSQVLSQLTFTVEALGKRVEELSANFGARLTVLENRVTMMGSDVQSVCVVFVRWLLVAWDHLGSNFQDLWLLVPGKQMQQVVFRNGPPSSGPSTTTLSSGAGSGGGHSRRFTAEQDSSTTSRSASARSSVDSFSRRSEHKVINFPIQP